MYCWESTSPVLTCGLHTWLRFTHDVTVVRGNLLAHVQASVYLLLIMLRSYDIVFERILRLLLFHAYFFLHACSACYAPDIVLERRFCFYTQISQKHSHSHESQFHMAHLASVKETHVCGSTLAIGCFVSSAGA